MEVNLNDFGIIFNRLLTYSGAIENEFAEIEATNRCKAEVTGRAYSLKRQPTAEETQVIEWMKIANQGNQNCTWSFVELQDIYSRTVEAVHRVMHERRQMKENFAVDLVTAYIRNCLNSDETGPRLHRDIIHSYFAPIDTDLTYKIPQVHQLAMNLVQNAGDVIDQFRTSIGKILIKLTAHPKYSVNWAAYIRLTTHVPWYWGRDLSGGLTWHHVATMLMIVADVICTLFKTHPLELAERKARFVLDIPTRVLETFFNQPNNWVMLKSMNLDQLPTSFTLPDYTPANMTYAKRQEILNRIGPCHSIKGVCPRPCPTLIDLAFSAFPGETIAARQKFYESNKPGICTNPIYV